MRVLLQILATLGWSILALFASVVTLCGSCGSFGEFFALVYGVRLDAGARDHAVNVLVRLAAVIAGLVLLLGILGKLPGTRHRPK